MIRDEEVEVGGLEGPPAAHNTGSIKWIQETVRGGRTVRVCDDLMEALQV